MSKKKSVSEPGYGKLLDAWVPPSDSGAAVGVLATSFTFSPAFFEEECLARFLQLESDPDEDGPVYLVEREEKMAQLIAAVALVDQHHCQGSRSLRWDLLSARLRPGILHSKVSLLCWANRIRLIIGSANLTEDGYRRNQEIYGILDFHEGSESPLIVLQESLQFLRTVVLLADSSEHPVAGRLRWNALLDHAEKHATSWGASEQNVARSALRVMPVFVGPGREKLFSQVKENWPGSSPPKEAHVVSPFFDDPAGANPTASELWSILRQRGEAAVHFYVTAEEVPGSDALMLHAPKSLTSSIPAGRASVDFGFHRLTIPPERPLHAKAIWFSDDRYELYLIGSSNFTSGGTGLKGDASNIEANLLYIADCNRDETAGKRLREVFPDSMPVQVDDLTQWQARRDESDEASGIALLPQGFGTASFSASDPDDQLVILQFGPTLPVEWALLFEDRDEVFLDRRMWCELGSPSQCEALWHEQRAPSGFRVRIQGVDGLAWWPVNVLSLADLPPVNELKDLPLEVLIAVLTSARPLHRVMADFLRKKGTGDSAEDVSPVDPHKKVDTTRFLLQRTRRISFALLALRERLQRPAATLQSLKWRLHGPVGVRALANALIRESHSEAEMAFVISELALELSRVRPQLSASCLPPEEHMLEVQKTIRDLKELVPADLSKLPVNLRDYVEAVFVRVWA